MHLPCRTLLLAALCVLSVPSVQAQTATDPSGHWEGTIQTPKMEIRIEVDLARNNKGEIAGTFTNRAENVRGLPLLQVAVEDRAISFYARADQPLKGTLSADGTSMAGNLMVVTVEGTFSLPFSLNRTGDARIEAPPRSAPIGKELEGTWNGTLDVNGKQLRAVLTMSNQPDGTSTGSLVSLDEGGLEMPVAIIPKGNHLTLDINVTGGSYSGTLNPEGTELVGTLTLRSLVAPLTFRRGGQ